MQLIMALVEYRRFYTQSAQLMLTS